LSDVGYNKIIERTRSILPEGNKLKENFYVAKSMMKLVGLGYQKIDMYPNFCMMYYLENVELTEYRTCDILIINSKVVRKGLLSHIKKLGYFSVTHKLQRLFMSPNTIGHMT